MGKFLSSLVFSLQYALEMLNVSVTSSTKEQLEDLCSKTIDNSQDFTDSVYISIEQREKLLEYHGKLQEQLAEIITIATNNNETSLSLASDVLPLAIQSIQQVGHDFRKQVVPICLFVALSSSWRLCLAARANGNLPFLGIFPHPRRKCSPERTENILADQPVRSATRSHRSIPGTSRDCH